MSEYESTDDPRLDESRESWAPRPPDPEANYAPGQLFGPDRYTDRFTAARAKVEAGFRGVTTDGNVIPGLFPLRKTGHNLDAARRILVKFLGTLAPTDRGRAQFQVDAPEIRLWHGFFTRLLRHGICFEEMSTSQRRLVDELLSASLSARGTKVIRDIRNTSELIAELSGRSVDFGENVYWLSVLGDPLVGDTWGWQIDGHHINLTYVVIGDQLTMTPTFLGAEPTSINSGRFAGTHLFSDEHADGQALFSALSESQRSQAVVGSTLPREVLAGSFSDDLKLSYGGIRADALDPNQTKLLTTAISRFVEVQPTEHAAIRMQEIAEHLNDTYFAWIGSSTGEPPFYYRVQSPVVLIEFEHIYGVGLTGDEHSPNHVHLVIRTPNGNDYGRDLLAQHHAASHGRR